MKSAVILASIALLSSAMSVLAAEQDSRVYELRIYYAPEGKLDDLHARFRDHTLKLFEKHGMTNIGYWVPLENKENKLVYILAFPDRTAQASSWKAFLADPQWKEVKAKTEVNGTLVSKIESVLLKATDYSPPIQVTRQGDRVFELRTYTAAPGRLGNLNARFRDHTLKLFEKYGITNVGYWVPLEGDRAENTLIYIVAHKSVESAKESFDGFRKDPAWLAARAASEEKAGGSLTVPEGVKSEFLKATDYSPLQ